MEEIVDAAATIIPEIKIKKSSEIAKILMSFASFGIVVLMMTLFYMGSLSHNGGMSKDYYEGNVTEAMNTLSKVGTEVVVSFYESGAKSPGTWTFLFWGSVVLWFYGLFSNIWKFSKKLKKEKKK